MSTYIKLEDVQKIISDYKYYHIPSINTAQSKINSLPSISFEEIIKQEIEEINKRMNTERLTDEGLQILESQRFGLRKLLNKLPK